MKTFLESSNASPSSRIITHECGNNPVKELYLKTSDRRGGELTGSLDKSTHPLLGITLLSPETSMFFFAYFKFTYHVISFLVLGGRLWALTPSCTLKYISSLLPCSHKTDDIARSFKGLLGK